MARYASPFPSTQRHDVLRRVVDGVLGGCGSVVCLMALAGMVVLGQGCTAMKANLQLVAAEQALLEAEREDAPRFAPFEYTMAEAYYNKALEEVAHSDNRTADVLARYSVTWSDRAIIFLEKRGRSALVPMVDDTKSPLQDETTEEVRVEPDAEQPDQQDIPDGSALDGSVPQPKDAPRTDEPPAEQAPTDEASTQEPTEPAGGDEQ